MACPLRIQFDGAFYHVMARGNARQDIVLDDADRQKFIDNLDRVAQRFDWTVWAWCLMDNDSDLLIETRQVCLKPEESSDCLFKAWSEAGSDEGRGGVSDASSPKSFTPRRPGNEAHSAHTTPSSRKRSAQRGVIRDPATLAVSPDRARVWRSRIGFAVRDDEG